MAFVVDNSVVIAWFLPSQATAYSERVLDRAATEALHAPAIWPLEFTNALWGLQRRKLLTPKQVDDIMEKAEGLSIKIDGVSPRMTQILQLARRHGLSSYDATYLELAIRRGLPIAAKDGPLAAAAEQTGLLL